MLFPYTYVPHQMEKMQDFIDFIFFAVWCKAPKLGPFGLHLFAANTKLYEVVKSFHYDDTIGAEFFNGHVERIYGLFSQLSPKDIKQFRCWYRSNNDLENVCANNPATRLARYEEIAPTHPELSKLLAVFFKGLYSQSLLDLSELRKKIGDIDDHYKSFMSTNATGRCPFCGINKLKGKYHSKREAYDHYLPKAFYPFNSISFRNLVPACHECNSSYKGSQDPAYTPKDPARNPARRKVFYPFSTQAYRIELQILLRHGDVKNLIPQDIDLYFGPPELSEKIDTWKDVYEIEERYRAELCSEDAQDWIEQVLTANRLHDETDGLIGKKPEAYLEEVACYASNAPYANENFLKHGFLQACKAVGFFT